MQQKKLYGFEFYSKTYISPKWRQQQFTLTIKVVLHSHIIPLLILEPNTLIFITTSFVNISPTMKSSYNSAPPRICWLTCSQSNSHTRLSRSFGLLSEWEST